MFTLDEIKKKLIYFCIVVLCFGTIIYLLRDGDHFIGLNETSDILDCVFYASITFSGSGYAEIYPQTGLGRIILLVLSVVKILIIILPLEKLEGEFFEVADTKITLEDVNEIIEDLDKINN